MTRPVVRWLLVVLACAALALPAHAVDPKEATGGLLVASDGQGSVRLFWFPPLASIPDAWRIEDAKSGAVLVKRVEPLPADVVAGLSDDEQQQVRSLREAMRRSLSADDRAMLLGIAALRTFSSWDFSRALGWAAILANQPAGSRTYRVVGLAASGSATSARIASVAVDPSVATPLAPAPVDLRAESVRAGVALRWKPAPSVRERPVGSYAVERVIDGEAAEITGEPLVLGTSWAHEVAVFTDLDPVYESEATYRVFAVDVLGRRGEAAEVRLAAKDVVALDPPLSVRVEWQGKAVKLDWDRPARPSTAGYAVERALLPGGPYELVTPKGVGRDRTELTDRDVRPGTTYYYRVRAMGPRGDLGAPSAVIAIQGEGKPPAQPGGLAAEVGRTRVSLAWKPVDDVAGYTVERRTAGSDEWMRLTDRPTPEPAYRDHFGFQRGGELEYRVASVGYDSTVSEPSQAVRVLLPDTLPPPTPRIVGARSEAGVIRLELRVGIPEEETHQIAVLRSEDAREPGLVMGDPIPTASAPMRFEDPHVSAGRIYWYRAVAIDRVGNRSEPSAPVPVPAERAEIPPARPPKARLAESPFRHVRVSFPAAPEGLETVVQARRAEGPWLVIGGPAMGAGEVVDANLPEEGALDYRLVLRAEDGAEGAPSDPVRAR